MKYIILASLLSSAAFAVPLAQPNRGNGNTGATTAGQTTTQQGTTGQQSTQQGTNGQTSGTQNVNTGGAATGQTPTAGDLATAVSNWMADTSMVSNFLNTGPNIQNNAQFKQAALVAFNAEVDELTHKAIIDAANSGDPNVQAANSTLATGGAFMDVVTKLQVMSVQGRAAVANIDLINQNRCVNVLPNIDAYMASTGSNSQAVRPIVCDQTGIAGGVQGTGATQPGAAAGTPNAAFLAAKALAQGTGSGLVDNDANGIPAAQAAAAAGLTPTGQATAGTIQGQQGLQGNGTAGTTQSQQGSGTAGTATGQQGTGTTGATQSQTSPQSTSTAAATQGQTGQQSTGTAGTTQGQKGQTGQQTQTGNNGNTSQRGQRAKAGGFFGQNTTGQRTQSAQGQRAQRQQGGATAGGAGRGAGATGATQ
ncbi:hypothetical protein P153DRAFT_388831 [Dothidotthia symphoricarpi CBS 119687]|uniref:Uncharacterized protein n=1 Tax=Dothidotthia symphoricarpi CBS 119687 TaxID=1392245 RepID=A0A6A6A643_9PLEO|nr:uncharacterized protein P153DRAFT_388831 [Dothidotthia symphoricarpi CBS 119687]KAF2126081.1 hypothetical protein P153DRAFT_388831 [Dothidotthia symphoricarpi CBS 119687]